MTISDLKYLRLHNQLISQQPYANAGNVVAALGAMQAQDYAAAKWAIGLRLPEATDEDIEAAIAQKTIVRTWALRGTLHFLAAADIHWILSLIAPRLNTLYASHFKRLELDSAVLSKSFSTIEKALRNGKQLTRTELAAILNKKGIATNDLRMNFILLRASLDKLICFGERNGKQFTHTLLDKWAPATKAIKKEEALAMLAERYLSSHAPSSLKDFVWWSGFPLTEAKAAFAMVDDKFEEKTIGGNAYWLPKKLPDFKKKQSLYLLPAFDEYLMGYADRTTVVDEKYLSHIATNNGIFNPTIVVNGHVEGNWKRTLKKDKVLVEPHIFEAISKSNQSALKAVSKRFGKFLNISAEIS
ncbi:winged helix DNA-binding domain-containing protein [Pinibacter aurantiacus]|uniref:Winged helix DNA-binding domain-containing protein n=1 Tax=Pinibacter aurantiacus TaxID=2851599 RepID=A0A9E2S5Z7_9BACT|nr:winged helix DNA-binding domain-containing protein [Pinibacter aurantiacus]MBV4356661.1 winged helix DNA-binding domain-containing protein [Pinibacter aurantiacus]